MNETAREGFRVVTLAGNRWGTFYVVMERSDPLAERKKPDWLRLEASPLLSRNTSG